MAVRGLLVAGLIFAMSGCRTGERQPLFRPKKPAEQSPLVVPPTPTPLPPGNGTPYVPPGAVPLNPPPPGNPAPFVPPAPVPANPPPPPQTSNFPPGPPAWQPGPSSPEKKQETQEPPRVSVLLFPPEPIPGQPPQARPDEGKNAKLYPPEPVRTEIARTAHRLPPPALPVGIPQFSSVKEQVAAGLRPSLDEGFDWLQANGYRGVLLIRSSGEEESADKKQVAKRGLRFFSLEISGQTLTRETVDAFNRLVADHSHYPLFVYDRDGSLAGALWYLHFRLAEHLPDDAARIRAGSLGFREGGDDSVRALWQATQRILGEK